MYSRPGAVHHPGRVRSVQVPVSRRSSLPILLSVATLLAGVTPASATMPPVSGGLPPEVSAAFQAGLFEVPTRPVELGVSTTQSTWRIPVILVSYADDSLVYRAASFDSTLFDSTQATPTGSVYDYYQWTSGGRLTVRGRVVATVRLPHDKLYYGFNCWGLSRVATPNNAAGLVQDALRICADQVRWSDFDIDRDGCVDMLWVVHPGIGGEASPNRYENDLWSITSRLSGYWSGSDSYQTDELVPGSLTQYMRLDRFSILPEMSYFAPGNISEIGVYCHEFGHAIGLPDLYDTRDGGLVNSGPGNWSLMGTGVYGGDGHSPQYPTHVGAWPALFMGWNSVVRPASDSTLVLPPISGGAPIVEFWFQGESSPEHFLLETRRRTGFDRNLPADGLVVYHVDDAVIGQGIQSNTVNSGPYPGLVVVEGDGSSHLRYGGNRGDAGDVFPGLSGRTFMDDDTPPPNTLTFGGAPTGIGIFGIAPEGQSVRFSLQVRAAGWLAAVDRTPAGFAPADLESPAATTAQGADGTLYLVTSEPRLGHQQVILHTCHAGAWDAGEVVTASPGDAFEPSIALLDGDDIALAWTDLRGGYARPYYRARVNGYWTPETQLTSTYADCRNPSVAADRRGGVTVVWVASNLGQGSVMMMRFPYLSPFGQPWRLTSQSSVPGKPLAVPLPGGGAVVMWVESSAWPPTLWFSRCARDSLPSAPQMLTQQDGFAQTWVSAVVESSGAMHVVWLEEGSGVGQMHYQCRRATGEFAPRDTTLVAGGNTLTNARLARDPQGGLHVAFERIVNGLSHVRYRRLHPVRGWDARSTDVSDLGTLSARQPEIFPTAPDQVAVVYRTAPAGVPRLMERRRVSDYPPALAVPPAHPGPVAAVELLPNPARAGEEVQLIWLDPAGSVVTPFDVYDLAGRRVASVEALSQGPALRGRLPAGLTRAWAAGMYFVRPRDRAVPATRLVVLR